MHWCVSDWKDILSSHETKISLKYPHGRKRVWRRQGETFAKWKCQPFGRGFIMLYGRQLLRRLYLSQFLCVLGPSMLTLQLENRWLGKLLLTT